MGFNFEYVGEVEPRRLPIDQLPEGIRKAVEAIQSQPAGTSVSHVIKILDEANKVIDPAKGEKQQKAFDEAVDTLRGMLKGLGVQVDTRYDRVALRRAPKRPKKTGEVETETPGGTAEGDVLGDLPVDPT